MVPKRLGLSLDEFPGDETESTRIIVACGKLLNGASKEPVAKVSCSHSSLLGWIKKIMCREVRGEPEDFSFGGCNFTIELV
jgi:hypothetical protein